MKKYYLPAIVSFFLFVLGIWSDTCLAGRSVTITLPDEVLHQSLVDALPIELQPGGSMKGIISIDSINTLKIKDKSITLSGVVSGHNLAMKTMVAGQSFDVQLGSVQLPPITCDLMVRFDQAKKTLLITPKFHQPPASVPNDPTNIVHLLLKSIDGKEYPVEFKDIAPFNAQLGDKVIPITLEPIDIVATENQLVLSLVPGINKATK
ncbi:MAG: hypothetical protein OEV64_10625 [Desulfobulbaceae bacterium]|nr:hypothetical protein [Desulfobulbaceae bacterium]